ncbi:hypothetical protein [Microbacterium sp. gxy059]|uniref:hypothetical protein n=1 Tax=Microbacterium sp. gxy059 TaxID=2957199 RepID=UPI003D98F3EE
MASNAPTAETPSDDFSRKDLVRVFARLKHEVGGLVDDSHRKSPFYARSRDEAIAKRKAAVKVLEEFADRIDMLKKENA